MKKSEVLLAIERLDQATRRLEEAIERTRDDLDRDGTIQRFEFTVELLWKTLRQLLRYQGVECQSPRNCIKLAFRHGLIDDDETILDMIDDRNRSSHVYNDATAQAIFTRIQVIFAGHIRQLVESLKHRV